MIFLEKLKQLPHEIRILSVSAFLLIFFSWWSGTNAVEITTNMAYWWGIASICSGIGGVVCVAACIGVIIRIMRNFLRTTIGKIFHIHTWSEWKLLDAGDIINTETQGRLGSWIEQFKTCKECGYIVTNKTRNV